MSDGKLPRGYTLYKTIHQARWPGVAYLSPKAYARDPWRAMEIALGLKPRQVTRELRKHKVIMETGELPPEERRLSPQEKIKRGLRR